MLKINRSGFRNFLTGTARILDLGGTTNRRKWADKQGINLKRLIMKLMMHGKLSAY